MKHHYKNPRHGVVVITKDQQNIQYIENYDEFIKELKNKTDIQTNDNVIITKKAHGVYIINVEKKNIRKIQDREAYQLPNRDKADVTKKKFIVGMKIENYQNETINISEIQKEMQINLKEKVTINSTCKPDFLNVVVYSPETWMAIRNMTSNELKVKTKTWIVTGKNGMQKQQNDINTKPTNQTQNKNTKQIAENSNQIIQQKKETQETLQNIIEDLKKQKLEIQNNNKIIIETGKQVRKNQK